MREGVIQQHYKITRWKFCKYVTTVFVTAAFFSKDTVPLADKVCTTFLYDDLTTTLLLARVSPTHQKQCLTRKNARDSDSETWFLPHSLKYFHTNYRLLLNGLTNYFGHTAFDNETRCRLVEYWRYHDNHIKCAIWKCCNRETAHLCIKLSCIERAGKRR